MTVPPAFDSPDTAAALAPPEPDQFVQPPPAPAPALAPKIAATWTGLLMALGGVAAVVGTFLPYEKFIVLITGKAVGTETFTGVGMHSTTGQPGLPPLHAANAGKIVLVLGAVLVVAAVLVIANRGRLWVGIVSLLMSAFAVIMCAASLSAPKSDAKTLNNLVASPDITVHVFARIGVDIAIAGAGVAVLAAILAICVRRRAA